MSHLDAVNKAIEAGGLDDLPVYAPLVELLRTLAGQMDVGDPSTRLSAAYLSALKDLGRVFDRLKVNVSGSSVDELQEFRQRLMKFSN